MGVPLAMETSDALWFQGLPGRSSYSHPTFVRRCVMGWKVQEGEER